MAAPVATVRGVVSAFKLENGYKSELTFGSIPTLKIYESQVGLPGLEGGDPIDTTTQQNITYRTMAPRSLVTLTPFQVVCAYDPAVYSSLLSLVNIEDTITVTWPDGSTLAFYGFLQTCEFNQMQDGEMPTVTLTIVPTNWDYVNCVEAGPTLVDLGTC